MNDNLLDEKIEELGQVKLAIVELALLTDDPQAVLGRVFTRYELFELLLSMDVDQDVFRRLGFYTLMEDPLLRKRE